MLDKLVDWPSEHKGEWPGWEQNLQGMAVDNQKRLSVYRTIKPPYLRLSFCGWTLGQDGQCFVELETAICHFCVLVMGSDWEIEGSEQVFITPMILYINNPMTYNHTLLNWLLLNTFSGTVSTQCHVPLLLKFYDTYEPLGNLVKLQILIDRSMVGPEILHF